MSDENNTDSDIRRVSRKDQKPRIDTGKLVFPPENLPQEAASPESPTSAPPPAERAVEDRYPPVNPLAEPPAPAAPPRRTKPRRTRWYNIGTVFFVLAGLGLLVYYTAIALNPYTPLNPFPPFTPVPIIVTTTPLPPTATTPPTATLTLTAPPTGTFTPLPAQALPTRPTFTPAPFPFTISNEGVIYERNLTDEGCDWVSIAGSVRGLNDEILNGYGVRIEGEGVDETVYTGGADSLFFEPGEFELLLGDTPAVAPYTVTLLSPEGETLSDGYLVITSDQCNQNVAVINFVQNRPVEQ